MNVAALLQETPSEDVAARRARSGSTAGGTNPGPPPGSAPPSSQMASADRERDRERERERDAWGRGRPPPPPGSAGLRSLVHSPVDTRSNPPDGYRSGAPLHIQSPPPSAMHHRNQPPLSPALSIKDSKNTSPSSSRASGYAGPHGHPHSSHPSPAMASLRPNAALASGSSANSVHNGSTSVNSGMGGGGEPRPASATGWPGPGYGGVERERRGSASAGIGGLLRSGQPHSQHSSHSASPVYEKEYQLPHQQQPGSRRKTVSSGGVALGGGQAANSSMPPPSQLVGPGTGTPPDDLPPLSHKSSSMAPPMSHSGALPSSMHGPPSAPTHQHTMSSSSFMERERDILLNREPRDHPMDHLRPSSTSGPAPPTSNPSGTPRQYHPSHGLPPSAPSVPRGGPPTSYSQPGSGRVTPLNDLERDRERERMYNREREHQHQRERALSSASASGAVGPSPMTSPRGVPYGPPPPPGHHSSQSLPPNSGQAGSPPGSSRSGGPGQSPHIHPASGASHAPPANPYAAASGGFGHAPYGSGPPPSSSGGGHGPPLPPTPSSAGPSTQSQLPSVGPPPPSSAKEREREFDMRDRERGKMAVERDRDFRDRDYQRERERERELRDREMSRDREMRERDMRDRELRDRELRERELRDREIRERDRERERDAVMREARPDPREMRDSRDVAGGSGGGRPDTREFRDARGEPRDVRADPRDLRTDPRADPYRERERDFRADTRDRERRDTRDRDWEMWDRKERERLDKLQWERDQQDREKEKERRDREQREHREQVDRQRELQEREAQEREKEQMMILREKVREKEMRDRERLLREREHQQLRERDGEARDGYTIIIGPGVPPSAPAAMRGEQQRAPAQGPPAGPSSITPGPHPPQSHHQGRFNTAFISNFAGPTERSSRNNSRVGSPNPVTLGSQMSTINMNVGSMPTIGPGVPGPANNSGGGMHVIPGGMLGGGLPSQGEPKGRGAASITSDRRDRDVRDLADSKDGIRDRERERERDHKKAMPMPQSSSSRVPGPSPKDQLPQAAIREGREKERERERERELYAAAIAGGSSTGPSGPSGRRHEGEHHVMGHSRHPSQAQQQQQQNMRERERDRERERERETRRHQSGPYPHQYDDIPGPRDRERERERDHGITIINPGQITPQSRDVDVEMGYGYPPPPHHTMGPPPPPGWHDVPGGPTPMEMGYHPGPPASHHPMHHHPPPQSQPYANYHPPPPGPYSAGGPPPPGYGQPPPPGYGHPHSQQQQYAYDDRGMPAPVDVNGVHHGSNGVVIVGGGNGAMHPGHSMPPAPPPHQQHPHHPPQHMYSVPPGYMSMQSGHHGLAVHGTDGAALGPGLTLPPSTLALTAASPLESLEDQPEDLRAAQESALLRLEEEREHERKPEVKAKTTVTLGTFVYPNLPFPYNFDLGGGIVTGKQVIVQEEPDKEPLSKEVQERNVVAKADGAEEGEIAEPADKGKAASSAVKDEPAAKPTKTSVVDPPAARTPTTDSYSAREADLDGATKVDDVEVDVETRVTIVVPHGHLPDEKPTRPRIWGGGVPPVSPFASNPKSGPSQSNGRTPNEPPAKKSPKAITRDSLVSLLPVPTLMLPSTSDIIAVRADFEAKRREEHHTYLNELENVGRTILSKYAPRRIYTDDSDLALCAIHSGWVSWHGVKEAKRQGRDLRVDVRVMRVATLGAAGQWSGREVGKIVEVQSYGKAGKGSAAERERKEEVVTRFIGGLGERCWSAKGKRGLAELGDESVSVDVPSNPSNDGRALMSAAWGTGHDGAAIEVLSAGFVERAASRKVPGLGRRNRAQRMMEYAERRMAILGQSPQQHHPLLKTITNGNINPRIVSSLTAKPWNFTTTAIAGRKRRRGYGCANPPHPPINARLPNATLLEAINELDELEREKGGRGAKRRRTGSLSEVVRLPGKTQEEWREEALMSLKTIVFATNTVPPPVSAEDSYPTSPTSPAGLNPITAGLLTAGGPSRKDSTTGEAVRVGYKYDRAVLKQMLFPSDPLPPTSNSLKTSPAVDKEKAQLSHFLGTLPRRQVILETATKERYLLAPKRADGSSDIAVSDSRKVLWAYDISLILEQEVIVEDVKDDPSGNVLAASTTSPDEGPALSAAVEIPQLVEPIQDLPLATGEEKKDDSQVSIEEREEGELESTDQAEQLPQISEPPQSAKDQDGDVEMDDGDKEPGELNEEEERGKILEKQPEAPQPPVVLSPSPTPVTSPPILKLDTINLAPSRAVSRVNSKLNSPVNPHSSAAPSAVGLDIAMDIAEEEVEDESFVTLIRGEDEEGNEQSVHYLVQMLQRHVTEPMLRFEEEGIYVKEASFVGPTVPPSPSTSVAGEADMEKMDVVGQGPGGQPTEWRMQVVSWKWAGQAWADY